MSGYIERWEEDYMVGDSRVSLASVVYGRREGLTPEEIQENYPALRLAQVYGALAFYLDHQAEVDAYLVALRVDFEQRRAAQAALLPEQIAKLHAARDRLARCEE